MDLSVSVAPEKQAASQPQAAAIRSPNASDLDEWLAKVEAMGELKRITAEVDPDLEAATITYLAGSQKSPALLFENIKGHPGHRALYNMIGCNLSRFCLMIGEEPVRPSAQGGAGTAAQDGSYHDAARGAGADCDLQSEHHHRR